MVEIEEKEKTQPPQQPFRRDGASEQSRPGPDQSAQQALGLGRSGCSIKKTQACLGCYLLTSACRVPRPSTLRVNLGLQDSLGCSDSKTTQVLGSAGPGPCQPGPLVGRGIAAGQFGTGM